MWMGVRGITIPSIGKSREDDERSTYLRVAPVKSHKGRTSALDDDSRNVAGGKHEIEIVSYRTSRTMCHVKAGHNLP
jgi:hypothetical protein